MALCPFALALISSAVAWLATKDYENRRVRIVLTVLIAACGAVTAYVTISAAYDWIAMTSIGASYLAVSAAAAYDFRLRLIPNLIPLALIAVRAVLFAVEFLGATETGLVIARLLSSVGGLAVSFALLAISAKLSKGGVGAGDIKLVSALGFACGFGFVLSALVLALLLCAAAGGALLLLRKANRKDTLPFAPFVWGGFVLLMILSAI